MSQFSSWDLAISISVEDTQTIYKTFNGSVGWCFSSNWKENWQKFLKGDAFSTWKGKQTKHTFLHFRCECAVCISQSLPLHFRSLKWKLQSFAGSVIMSVEVNRLIVHCMSTHSQRRVGLHEDQHFSQYCVRMLFQIFCIVWAISLVTSNVSSQSPVGHCNIRHRGEGGAGGALAPPLFWLIKLLFQFFSKVLHKKVHRVILCYLK